MTESDSPLELQHGYDFHVHLDRADTYDDRYFAHEGGLSTFVDAPLKAKQNITGMLHRGPAYEEASLRDRMRSVIERKIAAGEVGMNAVIDCSTDIDDRAFKTALELRQEYQERNYEINVGAYPIFGFKSWGSDRHELIKRLAPKAQFLMGLPERDDKPANTIGFDGHLHLLINLALEHKKPLQVHLDQTNTPVERGTERFIEAVHWLVTASGIPERERPEFWAVHAISPSCYSEERFHQLLKGLVENNIGVVVCPHAALSMRQMRNHHAPIHNSIARVREMILAGVKVRFGTDNLHDIFIPRPKEVTLSREIDALASATRFYNDSVLIKLFQGRELNETDRANIRRSIDGDKEAYGLA